MFMSMPSFIFAFAHNLIALPGLSCSTSGACSRIRSHSISAAISFALIRIQAVPFYDTAGSVRHVVSERWRDAAAIASRRAASLYSGKILLAGIEDDQQNYTRFSADQARKIERESCADRRANKTSLAFALKNMPGRCSKRSACSRCATSA